MYHTLQTLQAVNIIINKHLPVLLVALPVPALSLCICVRLPTFFFSLHVVCFVQRRYILLVPLAAALPRFRHKGALLGRHVREVSAYIPTGYVTIQ